jgi:predicted alpha/beta hydrolase
MFRNNCFQIEWPRFCVQNTTGFVRPHIYWLLHQHQCYLRLPVHATLDDDDDDVVVADVVVVVVVEAVVTMAVMMTVIQVDSQFHHNNISILDIYICSLCTDF